METHWDQLRTREVGQIYGPSLGWLNTMLEFFESDGFVPHFGSHSALDFTGEDLSGQIFDFHNTKLTDVIKNLEKRGFIEINLDDQKCYMLFYSKEDIDAYYDSLRRSVWRLALLNINNDFPFVIWSRNLKMEKYWDLLKKLQNISGHPDGRKFLSHFDSIYGRIHHGQDRNWMIKEEVCGFAAELIEIHRSRPR